uniref:Thyroglobulin type-1 domain-containing protein n=1 Tax=Strigamia maritima TaxID=126957 RepID=T1IZE9_STRMM
MISTRSFLLCLVVAAVSAIGPCDKEREKAQQNQNILGLFVPECKASGTYKAKQCHEAYCYCVDPQGTQIKGTIFRYKDSPESQCECAREKHYIQSHHLIGKLLSCDKFGDYRRSQCLGSVCHCVNPKDGSYIGNGVHITQKDSLNC